MIFAIRDGDEPSQKTRFIIQILEANRNKPVILISRNRIKRIDKRNTNKIELPPSKASIFAYYFLMIMKSPQDLSGSLQSRLFNKRRPVMLIGEGFFSVLSQVLHHYFAVARKNEISQYFEKLHSPSVFLIDEFLSVKTINMKLLKRYGYVIYVSQDVAYNRYGFQDSIITKNLMYNLEYEAVTSSDLVIASSERDRLKYIEMGSKKAIFYPNIYPLHQFEPGIKDESPSITIVSRGHWGAKASKSLEDIFKALSYVDYILNVNVIGVKPEHVPKNVHMHHYDFLPTKLDYLNILSKSWVGINIGFHLAGTNERKYDYAMAGQVVLSDTVGARGDLLPHEYIYVDVQDLAAKLVQLLQIGREKILQMGERNREQALLIAEKQQQEVTKTINDLTLSSKHGYQT